MNEEILLVLAFSGFWALIYLVLGGGFKSLLSGDTNKREEAFYFTLGIILVPLLIYFVALQFRPAGN